MVWPIQDNHLRYRCGKSLESRNSDRAFYQWHLLDKYGLPWEASPFLLEMCWVMQHIGLHADETSEKTYEHVNVEPIHLPTVREVLWWWRIHLAAPELGVEIGTANQFRSIAMEFIKRELLHEILGQPLEMADLEAWLVWKPWLDEVRDAEYHQAVSRGMIPLIHAEPRDRTFNHEEGSPIAYVLYPNTGFPPTMSRNSSVDEPTEADV